MDNKYKRHGAFSWCELLTTDVAQAKHFYSTLFGWRLEPAPIPGVDYTLVKCGGAQMGGIMAVPPEAQGMAPSWNVYVTVDEGAELHLERRVATKAAAVTTAGDYLWAPVA